jgi:hypothetical protein
MILSALSVSFSIKTKYDNIRQGIVIFGFHP